MFSWKNLKDQAAAMSNALQTRVAKYKNADFANASMAMCALVAAADGTIDALERQKTAALITNNETLKVFDLADLQTKFEFYCTKLSNDFDFGKIEALQAIAKLHKAPDQARAVIQIGIIIGGADGNFDPDEKNVVRAACNSVNIPVTDFDL